MVAPSVSSGDGAELERLYTQYLHAVERAHETLRSHGMNSEIFRKSDGEIEILRGRIKELLGAATEWDEWE